MRPLSPFFRDFSLIALYFYFHGTRLGKEKRKKKLQTKTTFSHENSPRKKRRIFQINLKKNVP